MKEKRREAPLGLLNLARPVPHGRLAFEIKYLARILALVSGVFKNKSPFRANVSQARVYEVRQT